MTILVFNVGSTTLKWAMFDDARTASIETASIENGLIDRIGQSGGDAADHVSAARSVLQDSHGHSIAAIGHRIVQGGDLFSGPALVDDETLKNLRTLDTLAPLHNPPARTVVEGLIDSGIPQTLVFDNAYFATLPPAAYRYAVPNDWYRDHGVRRYGFHGTSHQYVTAKAIDWLHGAGQSKTKLRTVSLHLGGGASATASVDGVAVDTSMGMTPLEGLVMATRSGDLDPAIVFHMMRQAGMSIDDVDRALNKQSGLLGICGESDMRAVLKRQRQGDEAATLAIDVFVRRIVKTVGAFAAVLGGIDVLVFTAGIGQHSPEIRSRVCRSLGYLGVQLDETSNESTAGEITDLTADGAPARTLVVATDEERAIARQVIVKDRSDDETSGRPSDPRQ